MIRVLIFFIIIQTSKDKIMHRNIETSSVRIAWHS
jgi:hypothetical protein